MFKKYIDAEKLLNILQTRDYEIKKRIDEVYYYFKRIEEINNNRIYEIQKQINNLEKEKNSNNKSDEETNEEDMYKIFDTEDQVTHIFEDEESALNYFKNKIWLKKAFQANKKMWELICEAIKDEDLELDKNEDYDE